MSGDDQRSVHAGLDDGGDARHELGNASLLLDAAIQLLAGPPASEGGPTDLATVVELLEDVKRRIDRIGR